MFIYKNVREFKTRVIRVQKRALKLRDAVAQLVETLRYKPEGRGFDSRWGQWDFSLI
jgi:hypothetical protein